jgi:hypothetical protein
MMAATPRAIFTALVVAADNRNELSGGTPAVSVGVHADKAVGTRIRQNRYQLSVREKRWFSKFGFPSVLPKAYLAGTLTRSEATC